MKNQKCSVCDFNEMGICKKCEKEIPIAHAMGKMPKRPGWCPLNTERRKK